MRLQKPCSFRHAQNVQDVRSIGQAEKLKLEACVREKEADESDFKKL